MTRRFRPAMIISIPLVVLSCGTGDLPLTYNAIHGSGDLVTVAREVDPFHSVRLKTEGDVNMAFGVEPSVVVEIDHNLLKFITTEVAGEVLVIGRKVPNDVKVTGQHLTVDIVMSDLRAITLEGVGTIAADSTTFVVDGVHVDLDGVGDLVLDVEAQQVTTSLSGVGDITLVGDVDSHDVSMTGVGTLRAFDLSTDHTTITTNSPDSAMVQVHNSLDATINGIGSVYYKGHPFTIDSTINGLGHLIDVN